MRATRLNAAGRKLRDDTRNAAMREKYGAARSEAPCPDCEGIGVVPVDHHNRDWRCSTCGGRGVVPVPSGPTEESEQ